MNNYQRDLVSLGYQIRVHDTDDGLEISTDIDTIKLPKEAYPSYLHAMKSKAMVDISKYNGKPLYEITLGDIPCAVIKAGYPKEINFTGLWDRLTISYGYTNDPILASRFDIYSPWAMPITKHKYTKDEADIHLVTVYSASEALTVLKELKNAAEQDIASGIYVPKDLEYDLELGLYYIKEGKTYPSKVIDKYYYGLPQ